MFTPPITTDHYYKGGSGDNTFTGTGRNDTFNLTQGGEETAGGGAGNDYFKMGATLDSGDRLSGGAGNDTVEIAGSSLTFSAHTIASVETLKLDNGFDYTLKMNNANVAKGASLTVDSSTLDMTHYLSFNGAGETDGSYKILAGAGNDVIIGSHHADIFDIHTGGTDTVQGRGGADVFRFGDQFNGFDIIAGGSGSDVIVLNGDYQVPVTLQSTTISSVEDIKLSDGNNYNLTLDNGNVAINGTLTIDGSKLGASHAIGIDASAETDGSVVVIGGAGNDVLYGGKLSSTLDLSHGGEDTATASGGSTLFQFGGALDVGDHIVGDVGSEIGLNGAYSGQLVLSDSTFSGVAQFFLGGDHNYNIKFSDGNISSGTSLTANTGGLSEGDTAKMDFSAETDGQVQFFDHAGNDTFSGGAMNDFFEMDNGGHDIVHGGGGADLIDLRSFWDAKDQIDGGAGDDELDVYSTDLTLTAKSLHSIELIKAGPDGALDLTFADGNVANGDRLTVQGYPDAKDVLDGSAETNGSFGFTGSDNNDVLTGGSGGDELAGGLGADKLTGGGGSDTFVYSNGAADSTGATFDHVIGFDPDADNFNVGGNVSAIDQTITHGSLSKATFDTDLHHAITASKLGVADAILFTPSAGDEKGHTFLIVDYNGNAGYQAGHDLVIELDSSVHLGHLSTNNFH